MQPDVPSHPTRHPHRVDHRPLGRVDPERLVGVGALLLALDIEGPRIKTCTWVAGSAIDGRWAPRGTATWIRSGTSSLRSQNASAEFRQIVPRGTRADTTANPDDIPIPAPGSCTTPRPTATNSPASRIRCSVVRPTPAATASETRNGCSPNRSRKISIPEAIGTNPTHELSLCAAFVPAVPIMIPRRR